MAMSRLSKETMIIAKAPEEVNPTMMTTAMWRVGSVLILNTNFMPGACSEGGNHIKKCEVCAGEGRLCKRIELGTMQPAKVMAMAFPWFVCVGS
jgi:hypothetical protein